MGCYSALEKKGMLSYEKTCETGGNYAKQNQSVTEGQILLCHLSEAYKVNQASLVA